MKINENKSKIRFSSNLPKKISQEKNNINSKKKSKSLNSKPNKIYNELDTNEYIIRNKTFTKIRKSVSFKIKTKTNQNHIIPFKKQKNNYYSLSDIDVFERSEQKNTEILPNDLFFSVEKSDNDSFLDEINFNEIDKKENKINDNYNNIINEEKNKFNKNQKFDEIDTEIDKNDDNCEDENDNKSYFEKGWEDFSFLEQQSFINDNHSTEKINNNNTFNTKNNFNYNIPQMYMGIKNFLINQQNFYLMNNYMNNYKNFYNYNYNYFMNNIIKNNPIIYNNKIYSTNQYAFLLFSNNYNKNNNIPKNIESPEKNTENKIKKGKHEKKEINKNNIIDLISIKLGLEKRTTIRMMNIPSYYSAYDLSVRIDQKFNIDSKKENRFYNYIYVPGSRKTLAQNVGFAFINFMHPKHIIKFYEYYQNRKLKTNKSNKICIITFADKQKMEGNFGEDINPNGNYLTFTDTKNHVMLLDN